jgi:hypothetical protein
MMKFLLGDQMARTSPWSLYRTSAARLRLFAVIQPDVAVGHRALL